jgi:hypothetical protein
MTFQTTISRLFQEELRRKPNGTLSGKPSSNFLDKREIQFLKEERKFY